MCRLQNIEKHWEVTANEIVNDLHIQVSMDLQDISINTNNRNALMTSCTVQLRWFFTDPPKPVGHKIEWGGLKFNDHR